MTNRLELHTGSDEIYGLKKEKTQMIVLLSTPRIDREFDTAINQRQRRGDLLRRVRERWIDGTLIDGELTDYRTDSLRYAIIVADEGGYGGGSGKNFSLAYPPLLTSILGRNYSSVRVAASFDGQISDEAQRSITQKLSGTEITTRGLVKRGDRRRNDDESSRIGANLVMSADIVVRTLRQTTIDEGFGNFIRDPRLGAVWVGRRMVDLEDLRERVNGGTLGLEIFDHYRIK